MAVTGATYTFLINGQPPAANWTALFNPGEKVRLRFINGSSMRKTRSLLKELISRTKMVAEPEGFEPSIRLFNRITV